jgi:hypothetical protein
VTQVYAITGSIGNARMILRQEIGDKIEKSILVKNTNDVPVNVELSVFGDLEKYITIKDQNFSLASGEEKKAFFVVNVQKEGTTESKINVKFSPVDGKNGVGLTSTIIVIAQNPYGNWKFLNIFGNKDLETVNESGEVSFGKTKLDSTNVVKRSDSGIIAAGSSTIVLFIIFLVLLFIASKHIKKKREIKIKKSFRNE